MRSASLRAASRNATSFIRLSACSGVLVRTWFTVQTSRFGESKLIMNGGATVRFQ